MTREHAIEFLKKEQKNPDTEAAHSHADGALCSLLIALGYGDVVNEWRKVKKYYA